MRMMGLPGYLHWSGWFLTAFISCLFTVILICVLLCINFKNAPVFEYVNPGIIFTTYIFYSISLILMMFLISSFSNNGKFKKNTPKNLTGLNLTRFLTANLALTAGIVIHLITFFAPFGAFAGEGNLYEYLLMP